MFPTPRNRYKEGMRPLDNMQALRRYYEAFKRIVGIKVDRQLVHSTSKTLIPSFSASAGSRVLQ